MDSIYRNGEKGEKNQITLIVSLSSTWCTRPIRSKCEGEQNDHHGRTISVHKCSFLCGHQKHNSRHFSNTEPLFVHSFIHSSHYLWSTASLAVTLQRFTTPNRTSSSTKMRTGCQSWTETLTTKQIKTKIKGSSFVCSTALEVKEAQEAQLKKTRWLATTEEPSKLHMYIHV